MLTSNIIMPKTEKRCPDCGGILQRERFGLVCERCNKEFYYKDMESTPRGNEKTGIKCPMCSFDLVQSPYDPKLYVCSNGRCPTRDEGDTPYTLQELRNIASSLKNIDQLIKESVQRHVQRGGNPPKTWEETRKILLADYPMLVPLFIPSKTIRRDERKEAYLTFFIVELLKRGWPEEEILKYLWARKMQAKREDQTKSIAHDR